MFGRATMPKFFAKSPLTPLDDNDTIHGFPPDGGVLLGKLAGE
jgi:hypothetical protein